MRTSCSIAWMIALVPACPLPAQQAKLGTYVGGAKADALTAAAVLPDGSVVVGGIVDAPAGAEKRGQLPGGGSGLLVAYDKEGKAVAERRLAQAVSDLDVGADGSVYAAGAFGSMKLDASLAKTLWAGATGDERSRICPGPDGGAVVLSKGQVVVLGARGAVRATLPVGGIDVAWHPAEKLIVVVGFRNKSGTPPGQRRYPVQVAYARAYDLGGKNVWTAYDWKGQQVADLHLMADTRAYRVAVGADGKLYVAGESAGGNSMWMRSSLDLGQPVDFVKDGPFQHAYNTGANHITAVVRLDAKTGRAEIATLLLSRSGRGRGANYRPRALAADRRGNVYLGGFTDDCPPKTKGSFGREGAGAYLLILDKHLKRLYATTLAAEGTTWGVAVGGGTIAAVGDCRGEDALPVLKPHKAKGDAPGDGFAVLLAATE